ncbi:hypothetical protein D6D54_06770 [Spiroplasma poulsonii]|uniref:Uncharacterized protein n=1 Tax=Spiroplasma poulsonii TaxID=2138 RepID=A0A3S0UM47_9MOLU|nr:hypothetical protein [Spiroplasma poulsonii]RUP76116.1 hypothetical protein D6D54_06770 [Spiroplasma poulsonii]
MSVSVSVLGSNNCSHFYDNVIRELSLIVNNEKIISHDNPVLALEIKLYYIMKSAKYNAAQKDQILKQMILERTKALEFKVTELIKEYAQVYQKIYQKPLYLQYAYISILKKAKYFVQERYGERLSIIRNFYCRYLEQGQWLELVDGIIAESQRRMQAAFFTKKEQ